jgi:hypothetical protein
MTKITTDKRLKRETLATDRMRPIIVELFPFYVGVRVKGTREFHAVPWDAILDLGRKLDAREKLAAKRGA